MAYAILRTYKHTTNGTLSSMGLHNQRSIHTPNADPTRTPKNKEMIGTGDYLVDVTNRLDSVAKEQEGKGSSLLIQKNSVKAIEHLMTASPEYFEGPNRTKKIQDFVKASGEFLQDTYGRENIVSVSLHLDETTPHLTAIVTPITVSKLKSGKEIKRLGAKKWLDGRDKMSQMQDKFADSCKHLGLERGNKKSKANHTTIKEFYSLVNRADESRKIEVPVPKIDKPGVMDFLNLSQWVEEQNQRIIKELKMSANKVHEKLSEKSFKTVKEVLKEKNYREDVEFKKVAKNALNELKNEITQKEGNNLKLELQLKDLEDKAVNTKEVLKSVLEGRYSPEELKKLADRIGARIIDKNKGLNI
ncbi:MAG: hypothetical protein GW839_10615 [Flavobacteriales bacterium]|nr:hypothetical protein [Flavobacteriales bacterium]PIS45482.1 MAG: hypothetical protein COT22_05050 [Ignavibacteria bacterium CG08_land_8_20_14_0_20_37_9]